MRFASCRAGGLVLAAALTGCEPSFNWRDVRPADSGVQLQFPCRPASQQRRVALAGSSLRLVLLSCRAGGLTWGLGYGDMGDPARVGPALAELAAAAAANVAAAPGSVQPLHVPGATPDAASLQTRLRGRLADGSPVEMAVGVFAHGTRVFQASALGEHLDDAAVEQFVASIRCHD